MKEKEKLTPSQVAGKNGAHIEYCIFGECSNRYNFIDDMDAKLELKSCQLYHRRTNKNDTAKSKRAGAFKINFDQHKFLLDIDGSYIFVVHDKGKILLKDIISAKQLEREMKILNRKLTKHHYFAINWKKIFPEISGWDSRITDLEVLNNVSH